MKYQFNDHTYDFTHYCLKYDGKAIVRKTDIALLYRALLDSIGYKYTIYNSDKRLPPVMITPIDVDYRFVRDCLKETVKQLSVANKEMLSVYLEQSLSSSGRFQDFVGLPIYTCIVYNSQHMEVAKVCSSYIEDFRKFLELQPGNYIVIS